MSQFIPEGICQACGKKGKLHLVQDMLLCYECEGDYYDLDDDSSERYAEDLAEERHQEQNYRDDAANDYSSSSAVWL